MTDEKIYTSRFFACPFISTCSFLKSFSFFSLFRFRVRLSVRSSRHKNNLTLKKFVFHFFSPLKIPIKRESSLYCFKYAGVWYEVYRHDVNEVNTKCENGTFTPGQNGTMQVQSQGFNQLNGYFNHTGLAKPRSTNEPASFLIHYVKPSK